MAPSAKVIQKLTEAAESGDANAQLRLGGYYLSGEGVEENLELGIKYLRLSADQGLAAAQTELGMCFREGDGLSKDLEKAAEWFLKAANQGSSEAQNALGLAYESGEGVPKDLTLSVKWFRVAAENGHAEAQCNLGVMYHLAQEFIIAHEWFEKSANQDDPGGQYNLGLMYKYGRGITQDKDKGEELLKKSADQGYDLAVAELARAHEDGDVELVAGNVGKAAEALKSLGLENKPTNGEILPA